MKSLKSSKLPKLKNPLKPSKSSLAGVACGLCCAGCVALLVAQVGNEAEQARAEALARYGGEQIEVCVANRGIAAGETISDAMVDTKLWLADLLPEGAATHASDVVGKQAGSSILEGEVISTQRLARADISLDIPEGMTAVSVPAKDVQAVGGVLQAGMLADVYAVGSTSTSLIASDVLVLATNLAEGNSLTSSGVAWVTLAVPPETVEELVAASQNFELYFTLPNSAAEEREGSSGSESLSGPGGGDERSASGGREAAAPQGSEEQAGVQDGEGGA